MDEFSTAIILAGGQSSRMGFDKQELKIHEIRLIDKIASNLRGEFKDIIIVSNRPELYSDFKGIVVEDIIKSKGPLGGIHAGLSHGKSKYSFVIACDMPKLNMDYIRHMKDRLSGDKSLGCVTKNGNIIEPFSGFYSLDLINSIEAYLESGRRSLNGFIKTINMTIIAEDEARKFSPNWEVFLNLNTREDLNKYLNTSTGCGS